ncbi:MAG TPA: hypothetical protein VGP10_06270 [Marisediminicola sp.]|nr:hypothetical protein [Marisediminicola sp.]
MCRLIHAAALRDQARVVVLSAGTDESWELAGLDAGRLSSPTATTGATR